MSNIVLIKNLKNLTTQQLKEFDRFIRSVYFNRNQQLIDLFQYLKKFHPNYIGLKDEKIIQKVFDGNISIRQLTKLRSELMGLFKKFIQVTYLEQDKFTADLYLLQHHHECNNIEHFSSTYNKLNDLLSAPGKIRDVNYQLNRYKLETALYNFVNSKDDKSLRELSKKIAHIGRDTGHKKVSKQLDHYYLLQKIIHVCQMLNYNKEKKKDRLSHMAIRQDFEQYFHILKPKGDIVYQVWLEAYALLSCDNNTQKEYYDRFKKSLVAHSNIFNVDDLRVLFGYLQNATKRRYNPNTKEYFQQLFQFFNIQRKSNVFERHLTSSILRNIVTVAIVLKEYDWINDFLKQKKSHILRFKDGAYDFSKTKVRYYEISESSNENIQEQLQNLYSQIVQEIEPKMVSIHEKLNVRMMKLQISYETRTDFDTTRDSVNKFLNTAFKNAQPNIRLLEGNRNFKNKLNSIYRNRENLEYNMNKTDSKENIKSLYLELNDYAVNIANRRWLIEQIKIVIRDFNVIIL